MPRQVRRYVMEDRFCAIRAAIGTAQARDVVVIAGKGNQDYQEYGDGEGGVIKVVPTLHDGHRAICIVA